MSAGWAIRLRPRSVYIFPLSGTSGSGYADVKCPSPEAGAEHSSAQFDVLIQPWEGKFAGGSAWLEAFAEVCIESEEKSACDFASLERTPVRLRAH